MYDENNKYKSVIIMTWYDIITNVKGSKQLKATVTYSLLSILGGSILVI